MPLKRQMRKRSGPKPRPGVAPRGGKRREWSCAPLASFARINVGPKIVARNASNSLNFKDALGGNAVSAPPIEGDAIHSKRFGNGFLSAA